MLVTNRAYDQGFYRDAADLSVTVISDERDYSGITVNEFTAWALGLKPEGTVYFDSIVGDRTCADAERGTGYIEVTENVGGILWDICTSDWSGLLAQLGLLSAGLKQEFFLSRLPVESTLSVLVRATDGVETPFAPETNWLYDPTRNSVPFRDYTPEPLAVVEITYEVLASSTLDPEAG